MKYFSTAILSILISFVSVFAIYNVLPLDILQVTQPTKLGATITTINGSDTLSSSRAVINTNFSNLNTQLLTVAGLTGGIISTSTTAVQGNLLYFSGWNTVANIATTSVTCTGNALSCTSFTVLGSSPISISGISLVATSSAETAGQIAVWGTTASTPARLYAIATSSVTTSAGLTSSGTFGSQIGGTALTLKQIENRSFSYSTTTWTGTTTIPLGLGYGEYWNYVKCSTATSTTDTTSSVKVDFYHGTTHFTFFTASTTVGTTTMNATNTFGESLFVDLGTPTNSPKRIFCTVNDTL